MNLFRRKDESGTQDAPLPPETGIPSEADGGTVVDGEVDFQALVRKLYYGEITWDEYVKTVIGDDP